MAGNDSSTGGPLAPASSPTPGEDLALDKIIQVLVTGITGISGDLVRPRWQPKPDQQPDVGIDWCALGTMLEDADAGPSLTHDPTLNGGTGADVYTRHEIIEAFVSFYGPNSQANASLLRDGLGIPQNTESLLAYDMRWFQCSAIRAVPEMVNQQWIRRQDLIARFRRKVTRVYPVLSIASSQTTIQTDQNLTDTVTVSGP